MSPKISTEILRLNVNTINREFADGDLENVFCVISATDDEQVNAHIFDLCSAKNILVNTVDNKEKCGFICAKKFGYGRNYHIGQKSDIRKIS